MYKIFSKIAVWLLAAGSAEAQYFNSIDLRAHGASPGQPGTFKMWSDYSTYRTITPIPTGFQFGGDIRFDTGSTYTIGTSSARALSVFGDTLNAYTAVRVKTAATLTMEGASTVTGDLLPTTAGSGNVGSASKAWGTVSTKRVNIVDSAGSSNTNGIDATVIGGGSQYMTLRDSANVPMLTLLRTPGNLAVFDMHITPNLANTYDVGDVVNAFRKGYFQSMSITGTVDSSLILGVEGNVSPISGATSSSLGASSRKWTSSFVNTGHYYTQLRVESGGTFLINDGAANGYVLTKNSTTGEYYGAAPSGGGVSSLTGSTGIGVSASTGAVLLTNTGVTFLSAGIGIGVSGGTGFSTISNTGILAGTAASGQTIGGSSARLTHVFSENFSAYSAVFIKNGAVLNLQSGSSVTAPNGSSGFSGTCTIGVLATVSAGIITAC